MQTVIGDNREKKIARIKALFNRLYCFTSAEIDDFMEKVATFPDDGLDKMIAALEEGKLQQDALIASRVRTDKSYVKDLGRFLNKTSVSLKNNWEKSQSDKAEDILGEI
jgi:hypothetical protein